MHRLVLGISGASGMPLAQAVLENLATVSDLEVHLIISAGAERVLQAEDSSVMRTVGTEQPMVATRLPV